MAGIGFGMGITRLILAMQQCGVVIENPNKPVLYIASMGKAAENRALTIVNGLRAAGVMADCDVMSRSLKAQMKYADKIGAKYVLMLGDNEIETGTAVLKEMATGEQREVRLDAIAEAL